MIKYLKNQSVFSNIRLVYVVCVLIYSVLRQNVTALQPVLMADIINIAVMLFAGALFIWDIFFLKNTLKMKYIWILSAIFVLTVISSCINFKYNFIDNIKASANLFIQFFILYVVSDKLDKKRIDFEIKTISAALGITWFITCLVSVIQYFFDITYNQIHYLWGEPVSIVQGFVHEHDGAVVMRLWGVFIDPNFAAMISVAVICLSLYVLKLYKKKIYKVLNIINIVVQFIYIVLSNSRSALLIILMTVFVFCWYFGFSLFKKFKKVAVREIVAILAATAVTCAGYMCVKLTKFVFPYMQYGVLYITDSLENGAEFNKQVESLERQDIESKEDVSNGRFAMWNEGFIVLKQNPIFGCGPRSYHSVAQSIDENLSIGSISIHNSYIELIVGNGIAGFLAYFLFFLLCAKDALVLRYRGLGSDFKVGLLMVTVLGCLACGMFISCLFYYLSGISLIAFICAGYAVKLIQCEKNEQQSEGK